MSPYEKQDEDSLRMPACLNCRKRKRKCTRGVPCSRCKSLGLKCFYGTTLVRNPSLEDLSQRVELLESILISQGVLNSKEEIASTSSPLNQSTSSDMDHRLHSVLVSSYTVVGNDNDNHLPPWNILDQLIDVYFDQIHPWIPILHIPSFRVATRSKDNVIVLQAIVCATVKFIKLSPEVQMYYYNECRKAVVLASMDRFSIESLQASIILAFETIGCGGGPRSWSIVSSATRIVEQLGLSMEEEDIENNSLLNRIGFLQKSTSASQRESRRRIFWALFLLDRFCSVTTGWNTSMLSNTIRRRLPMEGDNFAQNDDKNARYFNQFEASRDASTSDEDDALGGYSYLVEATESLSNVVSFLLHQTASLTSLKDAKEWFRKFKALDSILVKWKASLPEKWKSLRPTARGLDENLALAHVSHDTSVLLLHHNLAYPSVEFQMLGVWKQSVQTCVSAAIEISNITNQFLRRVKTILSPQFSFCIFIAARTLLANQLHSESDDESARHFDLLVASLRIISRRWTAYGSNKDDLAAKFAQRLEEAKNANSEIDARAAVFMDEDQQAGTVSILSPPVAETLQNIGTNAIEQMMNQEIVPDDLEFFKEKANINELDYIFRWDNEIDEWATSS